MRPHRGLFPFYQRIEIPMKIELSQPFAANGKVDEFDVKQMKKTLNRLGYYQPYEKVGIYCKRSFPKSIAQRDTTMAN